VENEAADRSFCLAADKTAAPAGPAAHDTAHQDPRAVPAADGSLPGRPGRGVPVTSWPGLPGSSGPGSLPCASQIAAAPRGSHDWGVSRPGGLVALMDGSVPVIEAAAIGAASDSSPRRSVTGPRSPDRGPPGPGSTTSEPAAPRRPRRPAGTRTTPTPVAPPWLSAGLLRRPGTRRRAPGWGQGPAQSRRTAQADPRHRRFCRESAAAVVELDHPAPLRGFCGRGAGRRISRAGFAETCAEQCSAGGD
jgi:hypothetical protein